jgi:hypothetical protein
MIANEVTDDMLAKVEKAVGFNCTHWQYADPREVIAASVNVCPPRAPDGPTMTKQLATVASSPATPAAKPPAEPEPSDADAHAKFYELLCDESDELHPSLDEKAMQIVRRRHPKLAAAHDRHEEKEAEASFARRTAYRGRFAHR